MERLRIITSLCLPLQPQVVPETTEVCKYIDYLLRVCAMGVGAWEKSLGRLGKVVRVWVNLKWEFLYVWKDSLILFDKI